MFYKILIKWYLHNKREMPWRLTNDPYKIWLSEIILQQTRVAQGLPYYERFIAAYPTVQNLAAASQEEVLKLWQGLGYYSRGRNLHTTAQHITTVLEGKFPSTYKELIKLKGVGDYTASAIASFSFGEVTAVVDGNVYRVLSRIFGIKTAINSTQGQKEFKALAQELIDPKQPATFNQALMEFGAIQCKPKNPTCLNCVFQERCVAFRSNTITNLPVKINKVKIKKRHLNYLVFVSKDQKTIMQQRTGKGIWQGLYEFPLIELKTQREQTVNYAQDNFRESDQVQEKLAQYKVYSFEQYNVKPIIHKLSHQHLHTTFWIVHVEKIEQGPTLLSEIKNVPVPILISRFIDSFTS